MKKNFTSLYPAKYLGIFNFGPQSRGFPCPANSVKLFSTHAESVKYRVDFTPKILPKSRIIIPVSMGRYQINEKKKSEYDEVLTSLFTYTSRLLETGEITKVDILSTAGLQRINWDSELAEKVESHFLKEHEVLLGKQSNCYKWEEWINKQGDDMFEKHYCDIKQRSAKGTKWYDLMIKTHENVGMSSDLDKSLEYQRREYAAIRLMEDYDQLIYTSHISLAWSYLYHVFNDAKLPIFTRANFDKQQTERCAISAADASHTTRIIVSMIEQTLTNLNFPKKEKGKIINMSTSLFYAYEPKFIESTKPDLFDPVALKK